MSRLLSTFTEIILPIIIFVLGIIGTIFLYKTVQKKFSKPLPQSLQRSKTPQVKLKENYCTEKEMVFLNALHKALPRECISFPNVGVSKLIEPKGNLVDYKIVMDKFVDVCVFLRKGMKPILVIDLYEPSPVAQQLKKFDDNVLAVLKEVKIPVLHKQIEQEYNEEELKIQVLQAMNNTTVAYLKDKIINENKQNQ